MSPDVQRVDTTLATTLPTTLSTYDADGNVLSISYPNGTETDYNYSNLWGQLNNGSETETVTNKRGSTFLSSFVYTFNVQRQKVQSVETVLNKGEGSSTTTTINWSYDGDGRLTDEVYSDGVSADAYQDHYQYDAAGNRIAEYFGWSGQYSYASSNAYTYNADGQLTNETDGIPFGSSTGTTNIVYHYDNNGSLIETDSTPMATGVTATTLYGYDARNRMVSMTNSSGVVTTYSYNDGGDRVGQATGSAVTTYVVDDNNPTRYSQVLETWTGGSMPSTTYEIGATIISQTTTGAGAGTEYLMPDGHGSTRQLTAYTTSGSANGKVVARYDYDGFGNAIALSGVESNVVNTVILYTGQMWDAGLAQYDLRARYYSPVLGRFTSFDPTSVSGADVFNSNKYLYAGSSPINAVDPAGLLSLGELAFTGALIGAGFGALSSYALYGSVHIQDVLIGAALGAVFLPLSVAVPLFGVGIGALGLASSSAVTYYVWTNPRSSNGQRAASIILIGASIFGAYKAGVNITANGWYNPEAFTTPPVVSTVGLSDPSPLSSLFEGIPDDTMVHGTPAPLDDVLPGVKPSGSTGKSYWFRWGDIKHFSVSQYQAQAGGMSQGGTPGSTNFVFRAPPFPDGLFQLGAKSAFGNFQEYEASQVVVPDAGGAAYPNH